MFYLLMDAEHFGMKAEHQYVRAPYDTLDNAKAQAEHNQKTGSQRPLRIIDDKGKVLVDYEKKK